MRNKVLTILCALLCLCLVAGVASAQKKDTSKFVDVSHYWTGDIPVNGQFEIVQDKWNEYLKTKLNCSMTIHWIAWADWYTKYNLILASGEPVDLIATSSTWLDLWPNAQRDAFMPLDTLLPVYAPTTWKEIPQKDWLQAKFNGKIVAIPENNYTQYVNHGMFYRGDWAKEFGIKLPITDWETFGKYLQGIKDNKPGVIPWDVQGSGSSVGVEIWGGYVTMKTNAVDPRVYIGNNLAVVWAKDYAHKYTLYSPIFDDTFLNYAKVMKQWGDAGYWRADVLNYQGQTDKLMKAGKTGAHQHHTQTYINDMKPIMDEQQPGSDCRFFAWCDAPNHNLVGEPITHGATSIGAASKNPERALMIYDLTRSDKYFYQLMQYGILGQHYVVKDGKRYFPENFDRDKQEWVSNFWGGRVDKFEIPNNRTFSGYKALWAQYDKYVKQYPYGRFVFDKTPIEAEIAALSDVANKYYLAICFGKAGDPTAAVKEFRDALKKAGFDKFMTEVQKQMTAFQKTMESK
jgi:putative aldouronate transport system substrate-binding protein